jgi:hypothetical protein
MARLIGWLINILSSFELTVILVTGIVTVTAITFMRSIGIYSDFINGIGFNYFW